MAQTSNSQEPCGAEGSEGDIFTDAIKRLDRAAGIVDIDAEAIERLKHPKAILEVPVPVRKSMVHWRFFVGSGFTTTTLAF